MTSPIPHLWLPYTQMQTTPAPLRAARTAGTRIMLDEVEAEVKENLVQGVTNGNITISDQAMSDVSGIFVGAVNSGHMAVIQQSLTFVVVTEQ